MYGSPLISIMVLCVGMLCAGLFTPKAGYANPNHSIADAITLLEETHEGRALISKSRKLWLSAFHGALETAFQWGPASKTDTVLSRKFDPETGKEERSRTLMIFLRKNQSLLELALDMAHELVHASAKPSYDPYDAELTLGRYIRSAIDGEGGEVDAVALECQIGQELVRKHGWQLRRCQRYLNHGTDLLAAREKIRKEFYRVGMWRSYLLKALGKEVRGFPYLSNSRPVLFSSTGQAPYPVALLREYEEITRAACSNSLKRHESLVSSAASSLFTIAASPTRTLDVFIHKRCSPLDPTRNLELRNP